MSNTSIDDLALAISDLATHMDKRFDAAEAQRKADVAAVDGRFKTMDERFDTAQEQHRIDMTAMEDHLYTKISYELGQLRTWIERVDSQLQGIQGDIKEIYNRLVALEQQSSRTFRELTEMRTKMNTLMSWARKVSKQTGIPLPRL